MLDETEQLSSEEIVAKIQTQAIVAGQLAMLARLSADSQRADRLTEKARLFIDHSIRLIAVHYFVIEEWMIKTGAWPVKQGPLT
jgi:hypothetical protein